MKTFALTALLFAANSALAANCFDRAGKVALALTSTETTERSTIEENYKMNEKTYVVTTGTSQKIYQYVVTFKPGCVVQNISVR